jgi:hypothetical protein
MERQIVINGDRTRVTPLNITRDRERVCLYGKSSRDESNGSDYGSNESLHFSAKGVTEGMEVFQMKDERLFPNHEFRAFIH